jgi:hypothetical protein
VIATTLASTLTRTHFSLRSHLLPAAT